MDDGSSPLWAVIFILFILAAYFALAETAFASANRARIKAAAENGNKRALKALRVLDEFDHAVTAILIGTNITHLGIASIVTVLVIRTWGQGLVTAGTLITTIAVFFFSEMLPKSIAKRYAEPFALFTARSLLLCMKLLKPLVKILAAIGQAAAKLTGEAEDVSVTEEELHEIIEDMTDDGVLDKGTSELISSALELSDIGIDDILTPRSEMKALRLDMSPDEILAFLLSHNHSRYPVYDGDMDCIVGTLQMRNYLKACRQEKKPELSELIDPTFFVGTDVTVLELIEEMKKHKVSLAIVRDENGATRGMTTIADATGALVGSSWTPAEGGELI